MSTSDSFLPQLTLYKWIMCWRRGSPWPLMFWNSPQTAPGRSLWFCAPVAESQTILTLFWVLKYFLIWEPAINCLDHPLIQTCQNSKPSELPNRSAECQVLAAWTQSRLLDSDFISALSSLVLDASFCSSAKCILQSTFLISVVAS